MNDRNPLTCGIAACSELLVKPASGWMRHLLPRMRSGDLSVVDDINRAYSQAVMAANSEHMATHGIAVPDEQGAGRPEGQQR